MMRRCTVCVFLKGEGTWSRSDLIGRGDHVSRDAGGVGGRGHCRGKREITRGGRPAGLHAQREERGGRQRDGEQTGDADPRRWTGDEEAREEEEE